MQAEENRGAATVSLYPLVTTRMFLFAATEA